MVEICVGVPDAGGVHGLMLRLAGVFGRSAVSYDGARKDVQIRSEWESRAVAQVIGAVSAWLAEDGVSNRELRRPDPRSATTCEAVPVLRSLDRGPSAPTALACSAAS